MTDCNETGEDIRPILCNSYRGVCKDAEKIISHPGTVSGVHYKGMKRVSRRHGVVIGGCDEWQNKPGEDKHD